MSDAERSKQLISEGAYNQCSLMIRVDGDEIEVPINFGHTADEIKQLYPFILPLVNQKIKNPAIEFAELTKNNVFDDLTDEEYSQLVINMQAQSKYWYDKKEASILELAVRFALDIKLRKFDDLVYLFSPIDRLEGVKPSALTEEETKKIVRDMKLEPTEELEKDAGEHDVDAGEGGSLSFNIYGSDITDESYTAELDSIEQDLVKDEVYKAIQNVEAADISMDKYKSTYKPGPYDESLVKDGRVDIYLDETPAQNNDSEDDVYSEDAIEDLLDEDTDVESEYEDEDIDNDTFDEEDGPANEDSFDADDFDEEDNDLDDDGLDEILADDNNDADLDKYAQQSKMDAQRISDLASDPEFDEEDDDFDVNKADAPLSKPSVPEDNFEDEDGFEDEDMFDAEDEFDESEDDDLYNEDEAPKQEPAPQKPNLVLLKQNGQRPVQPKPTSLDDDEIEYMFLDTGKKERTLKPSSDALDVDDFGFFAEKDKNKKNASNVRR